MRAYLYINDSQERHEDRYIFAKDCRQKSAENQKESQENQKEFRKSGQRLEKRSDVKRESERVTCPSVSHVQTVRITCLLFHHDKT